MNTADSLIIVAKFGRPHGIKGQVKVVSFTDPPENVLTYQPWCIKIKQQWQPIQIIRAEQHQQYVLAQIEGYPEREQVALLTNLEIAVPIEQLPALQPGEYYWHQLIGMQVMNQERHILGQVTEIIPTGANDVLVVAGKKRCLIPYIQTRYILSVDAENKMIQVDWDQDD